VLVVDLEIQIPAAALRWSFARSGGPGGQNVNKVNSKVLLHWNVRDSRDLPADVRERFLLRYANRITTEGDIVVQSQRFRDQGRNRDDCLEKLRQLILTVRHAPVRRRATRPTAGSRERRLRSKQHTSEKKRMRHRPGAGE
jgi:ribosome-associated protein